MFKQLRSGTKKEKGQVIVLVALMLMTLLGLTAVAIDLSHVFVQRRNMQNAADAGALAGARLVALFSADPTNNTRYRDVYLEALRAAEANGAQNITAYLVECESRALVERLRPTDYRGLHRCPCACGVWVKTENHFDTWLARIFGVNELSAEAEAQAEFGLPQSCTGVAPIALRNTVMEYGTWGKVGSTYTIWDSGKEASATRGWLGLDCKYPDHTSACSPSASDLGRWMDPPYYTGWIEYGQYIGGDPGTKTSVLNNHTTKGEILIIPIFDYVYHYTNSKYCDPNDPKYDRDKCYAGETYEGTIPVYSPDPGYNGKYYYHIVGFAAFEVDRVVSQGSKKGIAGKFISEVAQGDWRCPTCPGHVEYANGRTDSYGVVVVKLTK